MGHGNTHKGFRLRGAIPSERKFIRGVSEKQLLSYAETKWAALVYREIRRRLIRQRGAKAWH